MRTAFAVIVVFAAIVLLYKGLEVTLEWLWYGPIAGLFRFIVITGVIYLAFQLYSDSKRVNSN